MGGYLIYFLILLIIPIWASMRVKSTYKKYSKVANESGLTGAEVARGILDRNGLEHVDVEPFKGMLSDHYDPRSKTVRLSESNYYGHSIAGAAVAAHEVGHAIQDAKGYAPLKIRHALVPVANIGSSFSFILILAGMLMQAANLFLLGIVFMAAAVVFQIVTLPVEFNASSRAMKEISASGMIRADEQKGARKVLNAAALTYVAAALVALLELLRFVLMFVGMNNSDE
ncbi:zinc metallopeptidase [Fictibacillus iocasae]|uniref:Zinc metallopeptidase n=1 Tax=Fictibacillus iocasae TaxID=2715437 RepID=A0ABW2NPC3_9BACL